LFVKNTTLHTEAHFGEIVLCSSQQFAVCRAIFFLAAWCIALHWASSTMEHALALFFDGAQPRGMWLCVNDDRSARTVQA
jgi:hypothetical protein